MKKLVKESLLESIDDKDWGRMSDYNDIYMPDPTTENVLAALKRRLNKFNKLQKKF